MKLIKLLVISVLLVINLDAKQRVNVNFSKLQINDFIKLISKITKKNILVNYKIIGTVDLVSNAPIYDTELVGIMISVLESKGYTLIENGSIYEVVRSVDAAKHNTKVVKQGSKASGSLMVTQSVKVKGENVDIVAAKVRYLISKTAKLMTMKESNTLLITDYPKNIQTIKRIIKDISTDIDMVVKVIHIDHDEAKKVKAKLTVISKSLFNDKISSEAVNIVLDENTNSVILVGIKQNVSRLEKLINTLDVESTANNGVKIFPLKNSDSKSVLTSLNEIISKQTFVDPTLRPNLSASEEINAIIAIGDTANLKGIKQIIDELDKEKYQVYIQAKIIEINNNNSEEIGIKYGFAAGDVSSSGLYAMSANFGSDALTTAASSSVLDSLGSIGSGAKAGLAINATLDFLQTKGASKSISNPSILCINNKESSIYVGKTISVQNASTIGTTGLPTQSFKREEVGLTLKVKPRVSSIDKVTLEVEAILENVIDDGTNNATGQPVTSKQEVKTQAILRHGESIIIGGLVKSYELKSNSKIPILGHIPWLGELLFSSNNTRNEKDNLVIILTPYVIEKSEKLSLLQKDLGVLSNLQKEYNEKIFQRIEEESNPELKAEDLEAQELE